MMLVPSELFVATLEFVGALRVLGVNEPPRLVLTSVEDALLVLDEVDRTIPGVSALTSNEIKMAGAVFELLPRGPGLSEYKMAYGAYGRD